MKTYIYLGNRIEAKSKKEAYKKIKKILRKTK